MKRYNVPANEKKNILVCEMIRTKSLVKNDFFTKMSKKYSFSAPESTVDRSYRSVLNAERESGE